MIRHKPRSRSGITLTEILISIFIMGVGIISLATLFPLGLLRLREAARLSRSGYLAESAFSDLNVRNLLNKQSFLNPLVCPWYNTLSTVPYDPWVQDTASYTTVAGGAYRNAGPGLPVAYDPLWRFQTGVYADGTMPEARFASGVNITSGVNTVRDDPNGGATTATPSAHGLQRITNLNINLIGANTIPDAFASPEDIVLQAGDVSGATTAANSGLSPILPELTTINGVPTANIEWNYTWLFTGQQSDSSDGTVFNGDVVIMEKRPFGIDNGAVAGEPVVEAVFGYNTTLYKTSGNLGYGAAARRVVLLRWPASMPDPDVRVGNWIADVTYERVAAVDDARTYYLDPTTLTNPLSNPGYVSGIGIYFPYQRCYWYQIAKRTAPAAAEAFKGDGSTAYRSMTVWVTTDLRAQTLLDGSQTPVSPYHVNAALISPHVVSVFPRTIYSR